MHFHWSTMVLAGVLFSQFLELGYGTPLFDSSNWLDKLPSIEVKVKTDGISVRTGPSREEIYTIVGYIILGVILFLVFGITVAVVVYKCCFLRRSVQQLTVNTVPDIGPPFNLHPNLQNGSYIGSAANNTRGVGGNSIVNTHFWPPRSDNNGMIQHFDMKLAKSSNERPVTPRVYRSTS